MDVADYFTLSLCSHLIENYGVRENAPKSFTGGFSPQHKRTILTAMENSSDNAVPMEDLAERCGLSVGHFARAFRQSFGCSFRKYLVITRVKAAQRLLVESHASLKEIATQIGYADQPTFTESFTRVVGMPPGKYRRRFGLKQSASNTLPMNQAETLIERL